VTRCYICDKNDDVGELLSWERVHVSSHWRLALAFDASLPGWLVLVPRRHVEGLDALTRAEAAEMGLLLRDASAALVEVTGCQRTYTCCSRRQKASPTSTCTSFLVRLTCPSRTGGQASSPTWVRRRTSEFPRRHGTYSPHASARRWTDRRSVCATTRRASLADAGLVPGCVNGGRCEDGDHRRRP